MLLQTSGTSDTAGFSANHYAYTNRLPYKPLTHFLKLEVACSVEMFVRISKLQDIGTEEKTV
jgi:hypothetical protein